MANKTYAGIGSRNLSAIEKLLCFQIGVFMAKQGWTLHTGAAPGADQAFAAGALSVGGAVRLFLPWPSYEEDWVSKAKKRGAKVVFGLTPEAHASVSVFHPAPQALRQGARLLHARNYSIVSGVKFVIAFPKGTTMGGTGQGIRVAEGLEIPIRRLDDDATRKSVEARIK